MHKSIVKERIFLIQLVIRKKNKSMEKAGDHGETYDKNE